MVTVTVLYVLVNVAYYTILAPTELLLSDAVAVVHHILYCIKKEKSERCVYRVCLMSFLSPRHSPPMLFGDWILQFQYSWPYLASQHLMVASLCHQGILTS